MKKIIWFSLFFVLINLFSCKKASIQENRKSLRLELSELPKELQREYFSSLNSKQKAAIWIDKLNQVLSQDWLNKNQRKHLELSIPMLNSAIYIDGSPEREKFMTEFELKWRTKGIALFGFEQFRQIVTSLQDFEINESITKEIVPITEIADAFNCGCSEKSDWCWSWLNEACTGTCNLGSDGCGTFFAYECDGVCVQR